MISTARRRIDQRTPPNSFRIRLCNLPDNQYLTKEEVAKFLGCSPRTISRMVARFQIPPSVTLGKRAVWIAGGIKKWIYDAYCSGENSIKNEHKMLLHNVIK